jgi:hypothetical protein
MKRQFLGDSKDSFKWDYHDYLTTALRYPLLNIILMLTRDDNSIQGKTEPHLFPARKKVIEFCHDLKKQRDFQMLRELPSRTGATYNVELHKDETYFTHETRKQYFADISSEVRQVLLFDADNGFEPKKSNEKHMSYLDVEAILKQLSEEAVVSVFQHFRFIPYERDFAQIKERLGKCYCTAIYWHSQRSGIMFVSITKTKEMINKVLSINRQYSQDYPITLLP